MADLILSVFINVIFLNPVSLNALFMLVQFLKSSAFTDTCKTLPLQFLIRSNIDSIVIAPDVSKPFILVIFASQNIISIILMPLVLIRCNVSILAFLNMLPAFLTPIKSIVGAPTGNVKSLNASQQLLHYTTIPVNLFANLYNFCLKTAMSFMFFNISLPLLVILPLLLS